MEALPFFFLPADSFTPGASLAHADCAEMLAGQQAPRHRLAAKAEAHPGHLAAASATSIPATRAAGSGCQRPAPSADDSARLGPGWTARPLRAAGV